MYNEVYAAWQREIDDPTLQPLPADFYAQVANYVQNIKKQAQMLDKKALKTLLLEQELKNVSRIVRQLTWMRYKKLVKIINAGGKMPLDSLTDEEAHLVKGCLPFIDSYRAYVNTLLQGQTPTQTNVEKPVEKANKRVTLRFVKPMPAVIGGDMKTYGPFVPEDVASVPVENAKILVKQGFAIEVDVA